MTGPVTTEALVEAHRILREHLHVISPNGSLHYVGGIQEAAEAFAPVLADLQRVTAERDEAEATCRDNVAVANRWREKYHTATSELARLRAEGEAKDRALKDLEKAARPFAACVFNDNGDVTLSTGRLDVHDWLRLDRAQRTALARAATAREG